MQITHSDTSHLTKTEYDKAHNAGLIVDADIDPAANFLDIGQLLQSRNIAVISTNTGWTEVVLGSGATSQQATYLKINTGTTPNSKGERYIPFMLSLHTIFSTPYFDFTKKTYMFFNIARANTDPECITRLQLKTATTAEPAEHHGSQSLVPTSAGPHQDTSKKTQLKRSTSVEPPRRAVLCTNLRLAHGNACRCTRYALPF